MLVVVYTLTCEVEAHVEELPHLYCSDFLHHLIHPCLFSRHIISRNWGLDRVALKAKICISNLH